VILPGPLLSGFSVYYILSYLLIPNTITLPLSIISTILIFGLAKYYVHREENTATGNNGQKIEKSTSDTNIPHIVFIITYIILLAVLVNSYSTASSGLFITWEKFTGVQALELISAIAFCFFLPGYALVTVLNKKYKLSPLPKLLLAYLFSILIAGLEGYVIASLGYSISNTSMFLIGTYILIFVFCLLRLNAFSIGFYHLSKHLCHQSLSKINESIRRNYSQFIVFSSLFALVVFYTYYLNDGTIVVDQWYHHGRALLISSGLFRDLGPVDQWNPPFFSALLASFFNLSGSPSVNAYVSIGFLNIVPVFAFYYFFANWVPKNKQKATLIASTLFMLSSGFGWVYVLNAAVDSHSMVTFDVSSSVGILNEATEKTYDIGKPTTFIDVGHPDVTTPLIIISLPASFTLLGLVKEVELFYPSKKDNINSRRSNSNYIRILTYIAIVTAISFLGVISHDEFYLFIITACIAIVVFLPRLPINLNYSIFFVAFLLAFCLVILLDVFISPTRFYTSRTLLDIPLITLSFLFVSISWGLYFVFRKNKFSNKFGTSRIKQGIESATQLVTLKRIITLKFLNDYQLRFLKLTLGILIISAAAYFYIFTLFVWSNLSVNEVHSQIKPFSNVPWYLYPIKFGLTGLLGVAFILSYLIKKFEKEIFIFGIIAIVAFFAGPYYDEHRFGKYIMASMAAFAALLIYLIISSYLMKLESKFKALFVGLLLGIVVISSGLSIFMFAGYIELFAAKNELIEGGRRDFPTTSEIQFLNFLNNKIISSKAYNIAVPEKEVNNERGFVTKIYGFSAIPREKLLQSPLILNSSTLEDLYDLLNSSDTKFVILPKKDIIPQTEKEDILYSNNNKTNFNISDVIRFVLNNFPKVYEDENFIALQVLPLTPPSTSGSKVALVYQRDFHDLLPPVSNESLVLPADSGLFGPQRQESNVKNNSNYNNGYIIKNIERQNKNLFSTASSLILGTNVSRDKSKNITLWVQPLNLPSANESKNNRTIINYIEANFKIIDNIRTENKSEKKEADKFDAGVWWENDNAYYRLSVSDVGLQLSESPSKKSQSSEQHEQQNDRNGMKQESSLILSQNEEIKRQIGIWYNLKVVLLKNSIEIYVNDILRIKVPSRDYYQPSSAEKNNTDRSISRVGISTYYSRSEFKPLILGRISELEEQSYSPYQKLYYNHYYPLSILALSKIKYDSFIEGDMSAFSKKYVVLPFDIPSTQEKEPSKYLEFVNKGGNLIVMNSDNNSEGVFSKLLSIKPGNLTKFDRISPSNSNKIGDEKYSLNVSGIARSIEINPNSNLTVKSYYMNKDKNDKYQKVAPFAIEKNYGHGNGKIIFANVIGYFDSIFGNSFTSDVTSGSNKNQFFATLSKAAPLVGIPEDNLYVEKNSSQIPSRQTIRILGDIKILPQQTIMINTSSILFPDSNSSDINRTSYNLTAGAGYVSATPFQNISLTSQKILDDTHTAIDNNDNSNSMLKKISNDTHSYSFKKVIIRDLKLYGGPFEIVLNVTNSSRTLNLPTSSSYNDYIEMSIPRGFDMTIKVPNNNSSYAQLDTLKGDEKSTFQRIKVSGYSHDNNGSSKNTAQIFLHNVRADVQDIRLMPVLMKSPEIKIIQGDESKGSAGDETRSLFFTKLSPDKTLSEIRKEEGDIVIKLDHVDDYNKPYRNGTKTQFITYLKNDVQITNDNRSKIPADNQHSLFTSIISKRPGDISEYSKEQGIEVPLRKVLSSTPNIMVSIAIAVVMVIVLMLGWFKLAKFQRVK
jgi:hypothetical protein